MPFYFIKTHSPYKKTTKRHTSICGIFADTYMSVLLKFSYIRVVTVPSPLNPSKNHFLSVIKSDYTTFTTGSGVYVKQR